MRFSVVIPTYNRAHLIEKTLQSVLKQTYTNFEVIIVDNCSTDNTLEVLEKYADDSRIKVIVHDRNYERSRSRNTGMMNAAGEYLTFLDSDDLMKESCLEDASEFARKHPAYPVFHNRYMFCDEDETLIRRFQDSPDRNHPLNAILRGNFLACIGVFINREIYQRFRFVENKTIIGSEDWLFWIQVIAHTKKLGFIDKVNSFVVDHSERTENNRKPADFERQIVSLKEYVVNELQLTKKEKKTFEYSTAFLVAVDYCDAGQKKVALHKIRKLIRKYPGYLFDLKIANLLKNILLK